MAGGGPIPLDPEAYPSLGALLGDALLQFKTETALIEMSRRRQDACYSYLEMRAAARRLARQMQDQGVGAGDRIAIVMSNQARWLIGATAAFFRGAVLVPLDYKLTGPELRALLDHARPKMLYTEHPEWRKLRASGEIGCEIVWVSEAPAGADLGGAQRPDLETEGPPPEILPRARGDLACIVYSSGTGGEPKGCMLTHDCYLAQLGGLLQLFPMRPGDRYFSILPTNHAIDFMCGFVGPLVSGATVVHQRTLRPEFILKTMRRQRITHMAIVPLVLTAFERRLRERLDEQPAIKRRVVSALGMLNESLTRRRPRPRLSRRLLAPIHQAFGGHLRLLFCGGAFVDRGRAERFYRLGLPVVIGYGLTEACTVATVNGLAPFRADSVGKAVEGVEIAIRDPDAIGVGEVLIRGRTIMKGYLDDPQLTAETIDPEGWLHTGDLGWLDASHHLHLVGRSKNMIVTEGGKNIYPEDIEGAFEALPGCEELAVFAADYVWPRQGGLGGERLMCVLRPKADGDQDAEATLEGLLAALRRKNRELPDFKRVSAVLPWDQAFPRTASMKVKRAALAEALRQGCGRAALRTL